MSADIPVERIESYRNKRIFLVGGTSLDPVKWFDRVNETEVACWLEPHCGPTVVAGADSGNTAASTAVSADVESLLAELG